MPRPGQYITGKVEGSFCHVTAGLQLSPACPSDPSVLLNINYKILNQINTFGLSG